MASFDSYNDTLVKRMIPASLHTTGTATGSTIDTLGFESVTMSLDISALDAAATFTLTLWESDDSGMSGEAEVGSDFVLGTLPAVTDATDDTVYRFGYVGKKRYLRVKDVVTGQTTDAIASCVCFLSKPNVMPTVAQV